MLVDSAPLDDTVLAFFTRLLIKPVQFVDRHAHLLYVMSKTYHDVLSTRYMMRQIAGISGSSSELSNILRLMQFYFEQVS